MSKLTLEQLVRKITYLHIEQLVSKITTLNKMHHVLILAFADNVKSLLQENWPKEDEEEELTPPICGEFKVIDGRTFSFRDRKFNINRGIEKYTLNEDSLTFYSSFGDFGYFNLSNIFTMSYLDFDKYCNSSNEWFTEIKEEQPTFAIIDERTFSFGKRKFRLRDGIVYGSCESNISSDKRIYWDEIGNQYLYLFLCKSNSTKAVQVHDPIISMNNDPKFISKFFTEITEEPATDCHQLDDGWIKHEGNTGKCPVEEGTLLMIRRIDDKVFYWSAVAAHPYWRHTYPSWVAYKVIAPASEKWIPWNGGSCPVDKDVKVEIILRGGCKINEMSPAKEWGWKHRGDYFDLIAYRVVEPKKEEETQKQCRYDYVAIVQYYVKDEIHQGYALISQPFMKQPSGEYFKQEYALIWDNFSYPDGWNLSKSFFIRTSNIKNITYHLYRIDEGNGFGTMFQIPISYVTVTGGDLKNKKEK